MFGGRVGGDEDEAGRPIRDRTLQNPDAELPFGLGPGRDNEYPLTAPLDVAHTLH